MLPAALHRFFWDVDASALDLDRHATFVLERLLQHGDDEAIAWVRRRWSPDEIAAVVRTSRDLDRKTARFWQRFWQSMLGIPESEVRCLREPSPLRPGTFPPDRSA